MAKKILLIFAFLLGFFALTGVKSQAAVTGPAYVQEAENSKFVLSVNPKSLAIQVLDKSNGYVWQSSMADLQNQGLNGSWQQFADSAITIDYLNSFGKQRTADTANGAQIALMKVTNGFQANINFRMAGIRLILKVQLTDSGFEISVPQSSINESTMGKLADLSLYPFLGSTKLSETKGYMLIPDGSGAEISYQGSTPMTTAYQQYYYNQDLGVLGPSANKNPVTLPIYGIVNGDNALLSYVKSGAEYGQLNATKAGLQTNFNWITTKFFYRQSYSQPTSANQTGTGIQMYQVPSNPVDIDIKYNLLSGAKANSVGLAQSLQTELKSDGILHQQNTAAPVMSLYFLGAATKPGLFWKSLSVFTKASDLAQQIKSFGLANVAWSLDDWSHGGYDNVAPNPFPTDGAVGSTADFQNLTKTAQAKSDSFALDLYYGSVGVNNIQPSNIKHNRNAQSITGLAEDAVDPLAYSEMVVRDLPSLKALGAKSAVIHVLGGFLYSDWQDKSKPVTRTDAIKNQEEALSNLTKAGLSLTLDTPNLYAWKYAQTVQIPTTDSSYVYETASIPYLQDVLHGYLNYESSYANSASDAESYKLQNIATGAVPSVALTLSPSSALIKTSASDYFNTEFSNWKSQLKADYKDYERVAQATRGATITAQDISSNLTTTTYSNGTVIKVDFAKKSYQITEGGSK